MILIVWRPSLGPRASSTKTRIETSQNEAKSEVDYESEGKFHENKD